MCHIPGSNELLTHLSCRFEISRRRKSFKNHLEITSLVLIHCTERMFFTKLKALGNHARSLKSPPRSKKMDSLSLGANNFYMGQNVFFRPEMKVNHTTKSRFAQRRGVIQIKSGIQTDVFVSICNQSQKVFFEPIFPKPLTNHLRTSVCWVEKG